MRRVKAEIEIAAPVEKVWKVLNDFGSYPDWNPFLIKMLGEEKEGSLFQVTVKVPGGKKERTFESMLTRSIANQELLFRGSYVKGLLSGEHLFATKTIDAGRTKLGQSVVFSGLIRPLVGGTMRDTQVGLEQMNLALKERCER